MQLVSNEVLKSLFKAEQTILRMRGRNFKTLSLIDKDALIASLAVLLNASVAGFRPSTTVMAGIPRVSQRGGDVQFEDIH